MNFSKYAISKYTDLKTKCWKKKNQPLNSEDCNLALQADHKVRWFVDSGSSKHMTGRKHSFITLYEGKEGIVTFGNEQPTRIIGKGTVCLNNKNIMDENVLLIET